MFVTRCRDGLVLPSGHVRAEPAGPTQKTAEAANTSAKADGREVQCWSTRRWIWTQTAWTGIGMMAGYQRKTVTFQIRRSLSVGQARTGRYACSPTCCLDTQAAHQGHRHVPETSPAGATPGGSLDGGHISNSTSKQNRRVRALWPRPGEHESSMMSSWWADGDLVNRLVMRRSDLLAEGADGQREPGGKTLSRIPWVCPSQIATGRVNQG